MIVSVGFCLLVEFHLEQLLFHRLLGKSVGHICMYMVCGICSLMLVGMNNVNKMYNGYLIGVDI